MIKKIASFMLALTMVFTLPITTFAASPEDSTQPISAEEYAERYDITEDEVIHLEENLSEAKEVLKNISLEPGEEKIIPVSEHLNLWIETDATPISRATTYDRTITSTLSLKNVVGVTIVTLRSVGVFRTNGSTSKPIDAYGSYDAWVWNITNSSSSLGATAYNARVRNSFSGELNIGIDPVSMTIQSFSYTCTIYCNAVGTYSTSWS